MKRSLSALVVASLVALWLAMNPRAQSIATRTCTLVLSAASPL